MGNPSNSLAPRNYGAPGGAHAAAAQKEPLKLVNVYSNV